MATLRDVLKILRQYGISTREIVISTEVYTDIVRQVRDLIRDEDEDDDEFSELDGD